MLKATFSLSFPDAPHSTGFKQAVHDLPDDPRAAERQARKTIKTLFPRCRARLLSITEQKSKRKWQTLSPPRRIKRKKIAGDQR